MPPPSTSVFTRPSAPVLIAVFLGGGGLFMGLKWRAVFQRSEAAKKASTRDYAVVPGRSVNATVNTSKPPQTPLSNVTPLSSPIPNSPSIMNLVPSLLANPPPTTKLTLLTLPAEIRNKIYEFTWLASRDRDPKYDIPDFAIIRSGFQWRNIPSFPLFLVCKQVFSECLPIISSAYFEIKVFSDTEPRQVALRIRKNARICESARKVVIHASNMSGNIWVRKRSLVYIVQELKGMRKLREVVVRVSTSAVRLSDFMKLLKSLFLLLKRDKVLVFELYWVESGMIVQKSIIEGAISAVAERVGGKKAKASIKWIKVQDDLWRAH
ncbi:hypothetical protein B7494_g2890 [Chlorociboria aeruginascens]|nr:hypothetical protein B7494_g2890 [Chlorociboria aeruginascens]